MNFNIIIRVLQLYNFCKSVKILPLYLSFRIMRYIMNIEQLLRKSIHAYIQLQSLWNMLPSTSFRVAYIDYTYTIQYIMEQYTSYWCMQLTNIYPDSGRYTKLCLPEPHGRCSAYGVTDIPQLLSSIRWWSLVSKLSGASQACTSCRQSPLILSVHLTISPCVGCL